MKTCTKQRVTRGALLLLTFIPSGPPAAAQPSAAQLPTFAEMKDGWNTLTPGGETSCAVDADYRFFVRRAAPDRLLVFFEGGGACTNARNCDQAATFGGEPAFKTTASVAPPRGCRKYYAATLAGSGTRPRLASSSTCS